MTATATQARYHLPTKAIKSDCPDCSPSHRRTLSRFVDRETGETLPEEFGRCDRESNCGYFLSPYHKDQSGLSYADGQRGTEGKEYPEWNAPKPKTPTPIYTLPSEVMSQTLGHYERNEFARFLSNRFGYVAAAEMLERFGIGTSSRWPGACVFWLVDEQNRVRGGQITLYDQTGHKVKRTYTDEEGNPKIKVCITSVRAALKWKYRDLPPPRWLADFPDDAETWPVVFGLPQLQHAPAGMPVALVEGPKTAIVCSHLLPGFIWLAVGGKSYLKPERLAALRDRKIMLYPDLNAYRDLTNARGQKIKGWLTLANGLRADGFNVRVSDMLERLATDADRASGLDLADFLLREPNRIETLTEWLPGQIVTPNEKKVERLIVATSDDYPPEWDQPDPRGATPTMEAQTFFEWQRKYEYFGQMGLASLKNAPTNN